MEDQLPKITDTDIARIFRSVYGSTRFSATEKEFATALIEFQNDKFREYLEKKNANKSTA